MAKRKKRNAITLVSLLLALAALIGAYYWYSNRPAKDDTTEAAPTTHLASIDTTQLSSLHYVKDDADLTLILQGDKWISKDEPGRPINQDYVTAILNAVNEINADRVIAEKPENLTDYGLAEPSAYLQATQKDGTTVTLQIGDVVGNSLGYYGLVNNDGIVYLLPIEMGTALQYNNTQMTAVEKSPTITAANITGISITNSNGEDYELKYSDAKELDYSGNNIFSWQILKPYGEGYTADTSKISAVQANYTSFNYTKCVDYKGEDLSQYGLDNPAATIDINYFTPRTEPLPTPELDPQTGQQITEKTVNDPYEYKVYIGSKDEDGNYYARVEGSNSVYTISAASVDKMLTIDAFSLLNTYICIPNIETVDKVVFDISGKVYTMNIERTTQKKDDGTEETVATYYFNGNKVDEGAFKDLYTTMVSAQYDTEIKDDVKTEGIAPYLTMSYHIFGANERTITASFLPYNDSFFIVQKPEGARFFVDKRKIEDIAAVVSAFTGTAAK